MIHIRSLNPKNSPSSIDPKDTLKVWQERTLQTYLFIGIVAGIILSIFAYYQSLVDGKWVNFVGSIIFTLGSALLILFRSHSYWVRSILTLVVMFFFTNWVFSTKGWGIDSLSLLICFSFLSSILLFRKSARIGFGISLVTLLFWAILRYSDLVSTTTTAHSFIGILSELILVLLIGLIGNLAITSLKNGQIFQIDKITFLESDKTSMEEKLNSQASDLERRLLQLQTASEISQTISTILDPQSLLQQVAELVKERFNLYYVGVFLIDKTREYAILQYGTGEAGRRMIAARHRLAVGGYSMIGWATQMRKPRIALDVGEEAVHFDNPFLPNTRSELALPIITGQDVLGALTVQSEVQNAFDENDILILKSIADNLAVALDNANSYQRTQQALEEIRVLNRSYVKQAWWSILDQTGEIKVDFENQQISEQEKKRKTISIPIKIREESIGQFDIETTSSVLSPDQQELLESIATQTSIALENARLLEETQRKALQEQKLNELSSQISRALTIEEILKTATMEFGKLPEVSEASISLLPPEEINIKSQKALPGQEAR